MATAAQCGAGEGTENAYHLGLVAGREAGAIGCNWMFSPVADICMNWRNTEEVPTVGISLNFTNHLIDVPQLHTFVNAYGANRENIRAAIEKITGRSGFKGTARESVFCGRWDTRL